MPTPAERKALVFLAGLVVLGTGARMWNATAHASAPSLASQKALSRQLAAVDSVRAKAKRRTSGKRGRSAAPEVVVGTSRGSAALPSPREQAEIIMRRRAVAAATARGTVTGVVTPGGVPVVSPVPARGSGVVDLDRATEAEIEKLPRIGPVLARRIVADRDSLGPFGSMQALQRVKGIGPAMAAHLAPYVTFSLPPRHFPVLEQGSAGSPHRRRRRPP